MTPADPRPGLSPWRFVVSFGAVSLLMDFVYEGARSITGPLLAGLGASATVVGVVTGAGEAAALGLRLVSGPLADRTRRFWGLTIGGYALTALSVPLLGLTAILWMASPWSSPSASARPCAPRRRTPCSPTLPPSLAAAADSPSTRRWTRSAP